MATLLEIAKMTYAVYESNREEEKKHLPEGWEPLGPPHSPTSRSILFIGLQEEYYGQAYVNKKTKEIVVANRGTVVTNAHDLANDAWIGLGYEHKGQEHALTYFRAILSQYSNEYTVMSAGHSLGGNETAFIVKNLSPSGPVWGVGFQAPGIPMAKTEINIDAHQMLHLHNEGDPVTNQGWGTTRIGATGVLRSNEYSTMGNVHFLGPTIKTFELQPVLGNLTPEEYKSLFKIGGQELMDRIGKITPYEYQMARYQCERLPKLQESKKINELLTKVEKLRFLEPTQWATRYLARFNLELTDFVQEQAKLETNRKELKSLYNTLDQWFKDNKKEKSILIRSTSNTQASKLESLDKEIESLRLSMLIVMREEMLALETAAERLNKTFKNSEEPLFQVEMEKITTGKAELQATIDEAMSTASESEDERIKNIISDENPAVTADVRRKEARWNIERLNKYREHLFRGQFGNQADWGFIHATLDLVTKETSWIADQESRDQTGRTAIYKDVIGQIDRLESQLTSDIRELEKAQAIRQQALTHKDQEIAEAKKLIEERRKFIEISDHQAQTAVSRVESQLTTPLPGQFPIHDLDKQLGAAKTALGEIMRVKEKLAQTLDSSEQEGLVRLKKIDMKTIQDAMQKLALIHQQQESGRSTPQVPSQSGQGQSSSSSVRSTAMLGSKASDTVKTGTLDGLTHDQIIASHKPQKSTDIDSTFHVVATKEKNEEVHYVYLQSSAQKMNPTLVYIETPKDLAEDLRTNKPLTAEVKAYLVRQGKQPASTSVEPEHKTEEHSLFDHSVQEAIVVAKAQDLTGRRVDSSPLKVVGLKLLSDNNTLIYVEQPKKYKAQVEPNYYVMTISQTQASIIARQSGNGNMESLIGKTLGDLKKQKQPALYEQARYISKSKGKGIR